MPLKNVNEFSYLGSNIASTEKDVITHITKAWMALDILRMIWKSTLPDRMKRQFFRAVVESVLVYGSSTWTLTKRLEKLLDGSYTRMLCTVLNISWKEHLTRQRLYGTLPTLSSTIRERCLRFAGHCGRTKEELVSSMLLWTPKHGYTKVGRPSKTYIQLIAQDPGCKTEELKSLMQDRDQWRERVGLVWASRPTG